MTRSAVASLIVVGFAGLAWFGGGSRASALGSTADADSPQETSLEATVAEAAASFFADAPQAAGLSIAVVRSTEISTYHFGTTELGFELPPDDRTIYAIASITKTVVGSLLAKAAVDGRLALDDDVRNYLDGSYPNLEFDGQPVQIAHLVNHLSGLPHTLPDRPEMRHTYPSYEDDPVPWMDYVARALDGYTRADFLGDLSEVQLEVPPGTAFSYSNAAAQVAGLVLERVYARPLAVLVDSLVARALGMVGTGFTVEASDASRVAVGYDAAGRRMPKDLTAAGAAGGLMSTVEDLARYVRWHMDETDPAVRMSHASTAGHSRDSGPGLNWHVERSGDDIRRVSTDGNVPGFSSRIVFYPELEIGVVVLANELDRSIPSLTNRIANHILEYLDPRSF